MRQRKAWPGVVFLGVLALAGTGAAFAQEAKKEAAGMAVRPAELYACKTACSTATRAVSTSASACGARRP